jgi:hypothetical protein
MELVMSMSPRGLMIITIVIPMSGPAASQQRTGVKTGLTPQDWKYAMPEGVTVKEITYFSDGVGCYGKLFFPKGLATDAELRNRPGQGRPRFSIESDAPLLNAVSWPW